MSFVARMRAFSNGMQRGAMSVLVPCPQQFMILLQAEYSLHDSAGAKQI
jgi:hypothetical protein